MNRTCRECGRYLPSLASQRRGIGPKCAKKRRDRIAAGFSKQQVTEARDMLRHKQVKQIRRNVYQVKSYLTARTACNCLGGLYRPVEGSCKHQLAVRLLEVAGGTR